MKKKLLFVLFLTGVSTASFAQFKGKGSEKSSGSFFSRMFHGSQKPHAQMSHFGKKRKDANIQDNGTSFRRNNKSNYTVDGDGFGTPKQGRRRKRS